MSSFSNTPNFDSLLLQTLMGRTQINASHPLHTPPSVNRSLEDVLLDALKLSDSDDDDNKSELDKEEAKIEKEIIKRILANKSETLKPNSGEAVSIGEENHICVGFHEQPGSDYRVWEWHGHIMLFDEEDGYTPEYIYGNYFERVGSKPVVKEEEEEEDENDKDEKGGGKLGGLKELMGLGDSGAARIVHRNISVAGASSFN